MEQKQNSIPSAGAAADSEQKVEDTTSCQHSRKPLVVGSQSQTPYKEKSREELQTIVKEFLPKIKGLNESEISSVMNLIRYSVRNSSINVEFIDSEYDGRDKARANDN